jgi:signal transduction histidine kinase
MHYVAVAVAAGAGIVLVAATLHVLTGWPPRLIHVAAVATVPLPLGLLLWTSKRRERSAERLVAPAFSVVGLMALVVAVYAVVVLGLGRAPTQDERTLLVLSMVAAGISALLYVPTRKWLIDFTNRLVHGGHRSPEELVRMFGMRLSRAVPLEELLLQLAESLRSALVLEAAEVWTGAGGMLERVVSEPDRGPASLRLTEAEISVMARAGVSGRARIAVWLPGLLDDRGEALLRVAPIAHGGELFGLIVAERAPEGEPFDEEAERVLAALAGQVGLALRNVRLDSELQASLDELRRQAVELRASRARVVAAADAERRRIERDLHDGAQQYLVGVAANLGVVRGLTDSDPEQAKTVLDELQDSIEGAMRAFRDLAHGIYPPLLEDRGLADALAHAARQAPLPTRVEAGAVRRYDPGVEVTVYFCCLESLQNAAKHGGDGARAIVRVWEQEGGLLFDVTDDGRGLDGAAPGSGTGVANMRDRLEAVGGSLRIESTAGRGTRVLGTIPLTR